ncbi:superoxide dismutase family protein [Noviherbaspirillum pedocola]|uniref:Superoxide dismutase [Cu-Zn] n=1 Tax=Noviherbaspirillum pedocola TaxID=2801341 RepID=A0A934W525_9BURK|nr:superoxide dismutase family protein [Noviherbaspirillum pedocola]MBK4734487.1 superoxide dismutase family protein [Noviherbaspirillum pedocola]
MKKHAFLAVAGLFALSGCAMMRPVPIAVADVQPTQGNSAHGTVTFVERSGKIMADVELQGLRPGQHGIHIHEKGDCSAPDATSAGGHYNPTNEPHGAPDADKRHAGDFGNVTADASGNVSQKITVDTWRLGMTKVAQNTIAGRALVVHADPDDLASQPAGNSGKRVACGVITMQ